AAVADRSGVDDHGGPALPDLFGHTVLEEGAQDEVGVDPLDRAGQRLGGAVGGGELDADLVPLLAQGAPDALGESVERGREQQDLQFDSRRMGSRPRSTVS
ncbi:hypothetical protein ADL26_20975, partial [Thermoactinomyces vulgaris]